MFVEKRALRTTVKLFRALFKISEVAILANIEFLFRSEKGAPFHAVV